MEFPADFPREAQLKVREAEIAASQQVAKALAWRGINSIITGGLGAPLPPNESVQQYALSIFTMFAGEACELGRQHKWSRNRVDQTSREFLRAILIQAQHKYPSAAYLVNRMVDKASGSILPDGWGELESTPEWIKYREQLDSVGVAPEQASSAIDSTSYPNPWFIWESTRDLPGIRSRLHAACKNFIDQTKTKIFENKGLWRRVEVPIGGVTASHGEPNPEAMLGQFRTLFKWFVAELADAWIEHLVQRVGLRGKDAIEAFEEQTRNFAVQAIEHNWKWGSMYLHLGSVDPTLGPTITGDVIAVKIHELRSLWPTNSQSTASAARPQGHKPRLPGFVQSESAARKMEEFLRTKNILQKDFAKAVSCDERTLRRFRTTFKVRRDTFHAIAREMNIAIDELLKEE
jgi:hypothetical protein